MNYRDVLLDSATVTAGLRTSGQSIDLGGIGKGFAGDRIREIFKRFGIASAYSNLGGNVVALGTKPDGAPWRVGIQHPRQEKGLIGAVSVEHQEARSLPLDAVDFSKLSDGTYHGVYEGGMYKWRVNACDVTVTNGKVTGIQLAVSTENPDGKNLMHETLYDRVIQAQALQVDTVSGATLTSKAYLQCVENALIPAQQH